MRVGLSFVLSSSVDFFPGYCIDCFSFPIEQHKDKNICRLSIELLDTEDTHSEDPVEVEVRPVSRLPIYFQTEN